MDPNLVTTGLTVLGALVGALIGAVVGPWINRKASLDVAKQNLEGQRTLAQDEATRRLRQATVQPFLDIVHERSGKYLIWLNATIAGRGEAPEVRVHQFELWQHTGYQSASDEFRRAADRYIDADVQVDRILTTFRAVATDAEKLHESVAGFTAAFDELRVCALIVTRLGHEYIVYGSEAERSLDNPNTPLAGL